MFSFVSFAVTLAVNRCHSLSFVITRCFSLPLVTTRCITRYHSLSLVLPVVVTSCHSMYHPLSFYKQSYCIRIEFFTQIIAWNHGQVLFLFSLKKRSSHRSCFIKNGVLQIFAKFTGKQLCWNLFFNQVVDLRPAVLLKKRLQHRCFPVNLAKSLRTLFYRTPMVGASKKQNYNHINLKIIT